MGVALPSPRRAPLTPPLAPLRRLLPPRRPIDRRRLRQRTSPEPRPRGPGRRLQLAQLRVLRVPRVVPGRADANQLTPRSRPWVSCGRIDDCTSEWLIANCCVISIPPSASGAQLARIVESDSHAFFEAIPDAEQLCLIRQSLGK